MNERYIFPVYAIALPETYMNEYHEEVPSGRDVYEVWDQTCETVCCCAEWATATNIAYVINNFWKR